MDALISQWLIFEIIKMIFNIFINLVIMIPGLRKRTG